MTTIESPEHLIAEIRKARALLRTQEQAPNGYRESHVVLVNRADLNRALALLVYAEHEIANARKVAL